MLPAPLKVFWDYNRSKRLSGKKCQFFTNIRPIFWPFCPKFLKFWGCTNNKIAKILAIFSNFFNNSVGGYILKIWDLWIQNRLSYLNIRFWYRNYDYLRFSSPWKNCLPGKLLKTSKVFRKKLFLSQKPLLAIFEGMGSPKIFKITHQSAKTVIKVLFAFLISAKI